MYRQITEFKVFSFLGFRCRLHIMAKRLRKPVKNLLLWIAGGAAVVTLVMLLRVVGLYIKDLIVVLEHNDRQELMDFISSGSEMSGLFTIFVMSILQVVSIVLPGMLIQVSGALIYGWWKAFIVCWLGFVSGNALVFAAARIMKRSMTDALHLEKKGGWLIREMNRHNPAFVTAIACMVPGVPNGIIPYIAARTKLYLSQYVEAVASSCWIQILLNCIAGHFLVRGQYLFTVFAMLMQVVILIVVAKNREKILDLKK